MTSHTIFTPITQVGRIRPLPSPVIRGFACDPDVYAVLLAGGQAGSDLRTVLYDGAPMRNLSTFRARGLSTRLRNFTRATNCWDVGRESWIE